MFWFMEGICFLPTFLVIWSSSTFIVSYLVALFEHDVDVIFPYISDTGANPPESCIFGLMTETTVTSVHDAGALLFFFSGVLYTILQSIISYKAYPYGCSLALCHTRTGIATIAFLAVSPTVICAVFVTQTTLHRKTEDEVQYEHIFTRTQLT
ncbi:unnamed protein product [Coregonus sp. 'balchen']|nr:unnamed protein product [Coregonus sp. 'balchen']